MRRAIENFEKQFSDLYGSWLASIDTGARHSADPAPVVRSAATVEQAFGGLNSQLWDDPFEWTLPETLDSREKVRDYLREVAAAVASGFARLRTDEDLDREIWTPWGQMKIVELLSRTIRKAELLLFFDGSGS